MIAAQEITEVVGGPPDWSAMALAIVGWAIVVVVLWRFSKNHIPDAAKPAYYMRLLVAIQYSAFYTYHSIDHVWDPISHSGTVVWSRFNVGSVWVLFGLWIVGTIVSKAK